MIRRPPRSTHCISSAASDVYKRQGYIQLFAVNCCGLRIHSHALRHCSKLMAAAYYAISVGRSDGDAVTDSFKDGVIHTVWVDVLAFGKAIGMVMFDEKADAKGVIKAVYNNPLDMWRNEAMEFPYLARVARRVLATAATQAQSERMLSTAGLGEQQAWFA